MTHQVNLNAKNQLPGFGPVQLPTFALVLLLALLAALGWVYSAWAQRQTLLEQEKTAIAKLDAAVAELNEFQSQHPAINNEPALRAENETLNTQLDKARETYAGLAYQVENAIEGFNGSLMQLSDYDLNGLWLERIALQEGTRFFSVQGYARTPDKIPEYLDQLGQSEFSGLSIHNLSVNKQTAQNLWQFTISNQPNAEAGTQ